MIGLFQPGTRRGMFEMMIGSRKMTPPRMLRIVPFGLFHIFLRPNSSTRASSGVMVAHLTPTPCFWMAWAAVDGDLVVGLVAVLHAEVVVLEVHVEVGVDQGVLDPLPDDPGHLVAVELDDGSLDLDLRHVHTPRHHRRRRDERPDQLIRTADSSTSRYLAAVSRSGDAPDRIRSLA